MFDKLFQVKQDNNYLYKKKILNFKIYLKRSFQAR